MTGNQDGHPSFNEIRKFLEGRADRAGDCLIWHGPGRMVPRAGFQHVFGGRKGIPLLVHRVALELSLGYRLGPGVRVSRTCGEITCIEPSHMTVLPMKHKPCVYPELPESWDGDEYPSLLRIKQKLKGRGAWSGDCLLWDGPLDKHGYGRVNFGTHKKSRLLLIHRLAFEAHHERRITEGLVVNHLCGKPACFRPDHLEETSFAENIRYKTVLSSHNTSGYLHVHKRTKKGDYKVVVVKDGVSYRGGTYRSVHEARKAAQGLRDKLGIRVSPALA